MNGRDLYAMWRNCRAGATGTVIPSFDDLTNQDRASWDRLSDQVRDEIINDLRERGVMWEPTA